jgi:uncharacterized damage-inducible protein DinB
MTEAVRTEPWLRGTLTELPAVHRTVLHALQLAGEDLERWCVELSVEEFNARPGGVAPVAFHLRHIARSVDRLLTYAEGRELGEEQLESLKNELAPSTNPAAVFNELREALKRAGSRVRAFSAADLEAPRTVGRQLLPTTIGGLLVHIAEHTQRHVGQAITTAKIVRAARSA